MRILCEHFDRSTRLRLRSAPWSNTLTHASPQNITTVFRCPVIFVATSLVASARVAFTLHTSTTMATRQLQHHSQLLHSVVFHFLLLNVYMSAFGAISTTAAGTRKSFSSHFSPNFEQEYPHFTPFNAPDFIHADTESGVGDHADYNADSSVFVPVAAQQPTPVAAAPPLVSSHKLFSSSVSQKRIVQPKRQQLSDIVDAVDADDIKPFKSFVLDLYKNYRSAYMNGNQTIGGMLGVSPAEIEDVVMDEQRHEDEEPIVDEVLVVTDAPNKVRRKFKPKHQRKPSASQMPQPNQIFDDDEVKYNVGPGVNISVEPNKELVNVYLDEDCLKDVFTGNSIFFT